MNFKIKYLVFLLLTFFSKGFSQNLIPSTAYVQSCYNKHECYSISNSVLVFFNTQKNEFLAQVDFNKFKIGNDTLDEWLTGLAETHLVFKGQINSNNLLELTHHNSKPIIVHGILAFNGITKNCDVELNLFEIPKDALLYKENSQDYFDRININMQLAFYPHEFSIDKKHKHYTKSVTLAIYRGYLNELKPGMESLIK